MKTAFLFPGQGAQTVGMGKDVAQTFSEAAEIYSKANRLLGYDLSNICFDGPAEKLNTTTISQPALYVTSVAILEAMRTHKAFSDITPEVTAGLSLGEYTALYAAGVLSFEDGLKLVAKRGEAMQKAADRTKGTMVGIIGLDDEKVIRLCNEARGNDVLEAVNFNCPGQLVVSGGIEACKRAEALAVQYGAMKAVRLDVAGAFHTVMMASAAEALAAAISGTSLTLPAQTKVIANINAEYYSSTHEISLGLVKQLTQPILWQKCMKKLLDDGIEQFYEIGSGRVLTGLMRRIDRKAKITNISSLQNLQELSSCT